MLVAAALLTSLLAPSPVPPLPGDPAPGPAPAVSADTEGGSPTLEGSFARTRGVVTSAAEATALLGGHAPAPAGGFAGSSAGFLTLNDDPEGDMPREVIFSADGQEVLVVNRDTDTLTVFAAASGLISHTIDVGDFPVDVAVSPDGAYAVVPNVLDDTVSVVDLSSKTVAATIPVTGSQPFAVEVTGDSQTAVVALINDGVASAFSVIDLGTLAESHVIATGPQGVIGFFLTPESGIFGNVFTQFALGDDDTVAVLPDRGAGRVRIYEIATGTELADLAVAASPSSVDVHPDGTRGVVGHDSGGVLTTIDVVTRSVVQSVATGQSIQGHVVRISPSKLYGIAPISNNVIFVELTSGAISSTVPTGIVGDIELSFDGQYAFVSNFNSSVIDVATQSLVDVVSVAPTAEAAASPVAHRVVGLNNRFREDVHLYTLNGAASTLDAVVLSGEPAEGDAPRTVAVSGDGRLAVVTNNTSRNVSVVDLVAGSVRAWIDTGDRPLGVAVSGDGRTAVVCNGDQDTVSIIDLETDTLVRTLVVPSRPGEVLISPDSSTAYVTSIAGTDRVRRIALNGAASTITGSIVTGQMGSVIATYNTLSGMALSPDGSLLAVCVSFDDVVRLIDTASFTVVATVPVGDFPLKTVFQADGAKLWVGNAFGDSVSVVQVAGAGSSVVATIPNIDFPLVMLADPDGDDVYVGNFGTTPRLYVLDTATNGVATTVSLPAFARGGAVSATGDGVVLATVAGPFVHVDTSGAFPSIASQTPLSGDPPDLAWSDRLHRAVVTQPGPLDGVDLVDVPTPWTDVGGETLGANGRPTLLGGGTLVGGTPASLALRNAPPGALMVAWVALAPTPAAFFGGVVHTLPFNSQFLFFADADGRFAVTTTWPAGIPTNTNAWFQFLVQDPSVIFGITLSNALRATTP